MMPRIDLALPYDQGHDLKLPPGEALAASEAQSPITKLPAFRDANRAQYSILTPLEKKCLAWLAHRMPAWVNSDHLTALGFLGMALTGASFWLARWNHLGYLLAILCLAVNWFGDSLDGTLARTRNHLRPKYGFYVDHMVDTFGALFLLGGMALSGCMSPTVAAGLLIAYFMLAIEIYLATYTLGTFHLSFWKMGPTELRVILALGCVELYRGAAVHLAGAAYRLFDVGGAVAIMGILVTAVAATIRHTILLYRAEPLGAAVAAGDRKATGV
jgi:phosphatidylglycerophosphate synthase